MAVVSSNVPLILRLVSCSVAAANKAGIIIRSVLQNGDLGVVDKGCGKGEFDPQTIADRAAQKCIITSLQKKFPAVKIVGEEEDYSEIIEVAETEDDSNVLEQQCPPQLKDFKEEEVVIWVDPLDGTREFTDGLIEHVTVLIGISHGGKPIAGVIHQPFYKPEDNSKIIGRTIWGVQGIGSFGYKPTKHEGLVITTTRSHASQVNLDAITAMNPCRITRAGGSGYKALLVLLGEADAYVYASKGTKRWDTCAPDAILRAAGGNFTDVLGKSIQYDYSEDHNYMNYTGILATLANHDNLLSKIPQSVKTSVSANN